MPPTIRRALLVLPLAAAALVALPACATTEEAKKPAAAESSAPRAERSGSGIKVTTEPPEETSSTGPTFGDYAMVVPENAVYLPWKVVGGGIKGVSDGVRAGFDKGRMPLLGLLFSPVNAAVGLVTGVVEGAFMSPAAVGPSDYFGRAMAAPTKRATSIWWYP